MLLTGIEFEVKSQYGTRKRERIPRLSATLEKSSLVQRSSAPSLGLPVHIH